MSKSLVRSLWVFFCLTASIGNTMTTMRYFNPLVFGVLLIIFMVFLGIGLFLWWRISRSHVNKAASSPNVEHLAREPVQTASRLSADITSHNTMGGEIPPPYTAVALSPSHGTTQSPGAAVSSYGTAVTPGDTAGSAKNNTRPV